MFWPVFIKTDNQTQLVSIHVKPNLCRTVGRVVDSGSVRKLNHAIIALLRTICTFQHSADPNIRRCTRCLVQIQIQREIQKYSTCTFYPCSDPNIRGCTQFSCPQSARWLVRPNRVLSRNQAFQRRIPYLSRVEKRPQLGFVPHLQKKRTVLGSKNTRPNFTVVM